MLSATALKLTGNRKFKDGQYEQAIEDYAEALGLVGHAI